MAQENDNAQPLVSICVPAYKRPDLLEEALASCVSQDYRPLEIIVGDDSPGDASRRVVEAFETSDACTLRYVHNQPSLGQAGNVNMLFEQARGERLVLLHDDDVLLPGALTKLAQCWREHPELTAAFGKQYVINMSGETLWEDSAELNQKCYRTSKEAGAALTAMESALLQQFPNNGYMIDTAVAREVGYRDESEVGTNRWCDYDFGIRLAEHGSTFLFIDEHTAKYRITNEAVSRKGAPYYMFPRIKSIEVRASEKWAKEEALARIAPTVVRNYARSGEREEALRIYLSKHYPPRVRMSLRGLYHLLLIFHPGIASYLYRKFYAFTDWPEE